MAVMLNWVAGADWVKLNEDELLQLHSERDDLLTTATSFRDQYELEGLVVTLGARGVLAVTAVPRKPPT